MSISYRGGMIVGAHGSFVGIPKEAKYDSLQEFAEDHGMVTMAEYYDAGQEGLYIGFFVEDTSVEKIDDWLVDVRAKAKRFGEIAGTPANLIGTQDIT